MVLVFPFSFSFFLYNLLFLSLFYSLLPS
jgi:hypothetical protein